MVAIKNCNKCFLSKDLTCFSKTKSSKDGLSYTCKKCDSERRKKNREENIDRERERSRRYKMENPGYFKEYSAKYRARKSELEKERRRRDPEKYREYQRKWARENRNNPNIYFVKSKGRIREDSKRAQMKKRTRKVNEVLANSKICELMYYKYPEVYTCVCCFFMSIVGQVRLEKKIKTKDSEREQRKIFYKENREHVLKKYKEYYYRNVAMQVAKSKRNKAARIQRSPAWANNDVINDFYELREFISELSGEQWHVDHEVPLQGYNVSGLHVANNLRIIKAKDNLEKSNHFKPDEFVSHLISEREAYVRLVN